MKYVYLFNEYKNADLISKLGKKGKYLLEATNLGLPIPSGFIITTDACNQYYEDNQKINSEVSQQINEYILKLEEMAGKKIGDIKNPLLVAIKCGTREEIPNLMNTILNVGLTEEIVENLSNNTNNFVWIWELYLNFINDYSKNIMGINLEYFMHVQNVLRNKTELTKDDLKTFSIKLKDEYKLKTQTEFPDNSLYQVYSVIDAVFKSWNNPRITTYRADMDIPANNGLAIYVQSMVFGNRNKKSGIGIMFTRDPMTGDKKYIGDFFSESLYFPIDMDNSYIYDYQDYNLDNSTFAIEFPKEYDYLKEICILLENCYQDMLKLNFVIENDKLFIINVCKGKRTPQAALAIACDLAEEHKVLKRKNKI